MATGLANFNFQIGSIAEHVLHDLSYNYANVHALPQFEFLFLKSARIPSTDIHVSNFFQSCSNKRKKTRSFVQKFSNIAIVTKRNDMDISFIRSCQYHLNHKISSHTVISITRPAQ